MNGEEAVHGGGPKNASRGTVAKAASIAALSTSGDRRRLPGVGAPHDREFGRREDGGGSFGPKGGGWQRRVLALTGGPAGVIFRAEDAQNRRFAILCPTLSIRVGYR